MKLLGVDFGTKRVGLAVSDPGGRLAFPYKTIYKTTRDKLFAELTRVIEEERVEAVIIGLPIAPSAADGTEPLVMRQVRNFAESLGRRVLAPIHLVDERCSSLTAEEQLREAGLSGDALKAKLDQQAAVLILQTYIQSRPELCSN
jgi:putative Holliday junction resolvase